MRPSFFTLFKRGRYYHFPDPDDPGEVSRAMEEQERFTVAAIAFCLQHDDAFYHHFWRNVCWPDGIVRFPDVKASIELEPVYWADLLISGRIDGQDFVFVIECKVGASLKDHQNPNKALFSNEGGYGLAFVDAFNNCRLKYIVLGYQDDLHFPVTHDILRIELSQKRWRDLEAEAPETPLVSDLFDSLGSLRVGDFWIRKAKTLKITEGIETVGTAWLIIDSVIKRLELNSRHCQMDAAEIEDSGSCFGAYILEKGNSKLHEALKRLSGRRSWALAWFGYEYRKSTNTKRVIWIYCETKETAEKLKALLEVPTFEVRIAYDNKTPCVVITETCADKQFDLDWFVSKLSYFRDSCVSV